MTRMTWRRVSGALAWVEAAGVVGFYAVVARRTGVHRTPLQVPGGAHGRPPDAPTGGGGMERDGEPVEDRAEEPLVSIVLPARDEERNIRGCVESLLAQDYPRFEVIVVDDASTDATPAILAEIRREHPRRDRLGVVRVAMLPPGWAGKPHAIATGAEQARGEWLLFTDADTRHAPHALHPAMGLAREHGDDLFSLGTRQDVPDFWGRVLMPLAYTGIAMMYPPEQVNDPRSPVAIANGQYILLRRAMYERVGGYSAPRLRATVLDDRDLAREVKRAGGRMEMVDGRTLVSTRMYQALSEHWEGWSKNAYAGSRGGLPFYLVMIVGLPMVTIAPFALLLAGVVTRRSRFALPGAAAVAATLAYRSGVQREMAVPFRYAWTQPLAGAVFTGILLRSFWRVATGRGVVWRGRTIRVE
ncbi:MAG: glycosyltransferase [Ktedonobacterales bacterium]